jgi:hypothetical protein
MNHTITFRIQTHVEVDLEQFLPIAELIAARMPSAPSEIQTETSESTKLERLAFSVKETSEMLGIAEKTVHRLLGRGLLKSSGALRHKLVPRAEIERFLHETS